MLVTPARSTVRWILKPGVFAISLLPFATLVWEFFRGQLGVNPVETLTHETGIWSLRFLLITLAVTPLTRLIGQGWPLQFRRMLGLFSFFYLCLHFLIYVYLDHLFNLASIWDDIVLRKFITVGFAAFVLMIPLAVTSLAVLRRKMGRHWATLHKMVYACAGLGVLHFFWLVKADIREPLIYVFLYAALMAPRVYQWIARPRATTA